MLGLCRHTQLPKLMIYLIHIRGNSVLYASVIMILQLLSLRRHGAEQSSARMHQIRSFQVLLTVNDEIFLLRSHIIQHPLRRCIAEKADNAQRLVIDGLHRAQKRGFLIQSLPLVRTKSGRNTKRYPQSILPQKCRRCAVPGRIPPCFKGGAQASGWKAGGVGFSLGQFPCRKLHNNLPRRIGCGNKRLMLFRRYSGQGLEPMGIMGRPVLHRPFLHGMRYGSRNTEIQLRPVFNGLFQFPVYIAGQLLLHHCVIKYIAAEKISYIF